MVILSADRTCDLNEELLEQYDVHTIPYHILLGEKEYFDNVDVDIFDVYRYYDEHKVLPKTSAVSPGEYAAYFESLLKDDDTEVVHFSLGSSLSTSYQSCIAAASAYEGRVFIIDAKNLSSAVGLQVLDAGDMIKQGKSAAEIYDYFTTHNQCYHASFVLGTLEYLRAGGRCSAMAAFSASLLNIRPCVVVDNTTGGMDVFKKYRGSTEKVLKKYAREELGRFSDVKTDKVFVTDSGFPAEITDMVEQVVLEELPFEKVYHARSSCTISSHCGPNCLGVLFVTESPAK